MRNDVGLRALMNPASVALIGASNRRSSFMSRPLRFLREWRYPGAVYPVNPQTESIDGTPCYPSVGDAPGPVDLAVIMVGAGRVLGELRAAADQGARAAVVFSSGFSEVGADGARMQAELVATARDRGMVLLGPNSQGLINSRARLAATFTSSFDPDAVGGSVAYIGQSGALGGVVMSRARQYGLGISTWITTGNQPDLDVVTMAQYVLEQSDISSAMLYLEQIPDFASYTSLLETASGQGKSLVVLRAGASEAGARVIAGHTGALVSNSRPFELLSEEHGVQLVRDLDDFIAGGVGLGLGPERAPDARTGGRRIAIATTSGGAGSLAADLAADAGLDVGAMAGPEELEGYLPSFATPANPLDLTGQFFMQDEPDLLAVVTGLTASTDADCALIVVTNIELDLAQHIVGVLHSVGEMRIPVAVCWLGSNDEAWRYASAELSGRIPFFDTLRGGVESLRSALQAVRRGPVRRETGDAGDERPPRLPSGVVNGADGYGFLAELGIPTPGHVALRDGERYDGGLAEPLAVKANSPALTHKSDSGAVILGVSRSEVAEAVGLVRDRARAVVGADAPLEVAVEEMVPAGTEMIVGFSASADGYPPVVVVGMGGVAAEVDPDVVSALAPLTPAQVEEMVARLRHAPLFEGFRGAAALDIRALGDAVARLSRAIATADPVVQELEINPLIVRPAGQGVMAVDFFARIDGEEELS